MAPEVGLGDFPSSFDIDSQFFCVKIKSISKTRCYQNVLRINFTAQFTAHLSLGRGLCPQQFKFATPKNHICPARRV
jgi:hypothetical protein